MPKIALGGGHGKNTPGKRSPDGKVREWYPNDAVLEKVERKLKDYENVQVKIMSDPDGSDDIPLSQRARMANDWGADIYVSIHHNAAGSGGWNSAHGMETYILDTKFKDAYNLATNVHRGIVNQTGLKNRGVRTANFQILRETKMTAILVEGPFMTNREEAKLMMMDSYQENMATGIVEGIVRHLNLKKKEGAKPAAKPNPTTLYKVQVGAFSKKGNAIGLSNDIKSKVKVDTMIVREGGLYKVQAGAFSSESNAKNRAKAIQDKLKIKPYIVKE